MRHKCEPRVQTANHRLQVAHVTKISNQVDANTSLCAELAGIPFRAEGPWSMRPAYAAHSVSLASDLA